MDTDDSGEGLGAVFSQSIEGHCLCQQDVGIKQNENTVPPVVRCWHLCGLLNTSGHTCMASDSQCVLTTVPCNGCEVFMNLKVK